MNNGFFIYFLIHFQILQQNELNQMLQGENKLIIDCYEHIKTFIMKLKLYESQLKSNNLTHFPLLSNFKTEKTFLNT